MNDLQLDLLDPDQWTGKDIPLPKIGDRRPAAHVFERDALLAVRAALVCGRPLLVRGEPGVGKSQLARAIAKQLGRVFLPKFVDARTEAHDLLWFHDAITRLAEAQAWAHRVGVPVSVAAKPGEGEAASVSDAREPDVEKAATPPPAVIDLARKRYVIPGPLWWAVHWEHALEHAKNVVLPVPVPTSEGGDPANGVVLLIDEIDKADASVPNGLLECLGQGTFSVPGLDEPVRAKAPLPLVILTTNDDRILPAAFVRRCLVLWLRMPEDDAALVDWLVVRGRAHFEKQLEDETLKVAAQQVARDRASVRAARLCAPGLAEYIDLLTVLAEDPTQKVESLAEFFLHKHADPRARGRR